MERSASYSERSRSTTTATGAGAGNDLRCHSAYYVTSTYAPAPPSMEDAGSKAKNKKAAATWPSSASATAASKRRMWGVLGDPELQWRRRVAGYRVYGVEGKVKVSLKSSMRWIKGKCSRVVDGWW